MTARRYDLHMNFIFIAIINMQQVLRHDQLSLYAGNTKELEKAG